MRARVIDEAPSQCKAAEIDLESLGDLLPVAGGGEYVLYVSSSKKVLAFA
jgi:hypothetical protein